MPRAAAAYLEATRTDWPEGRPAEGIAMIPVADALAAVELALVESEKYYTLLLAALRKARPVVLPTSVIN